MKVNDNCGPTMPKRKGVLEPLSAPILISNNSTTERQMTKNTTVLEPLVHPRSSSVGASEKPDVVVRINIKELVNTIQPILSDSKSPKTPLILDCSGRAEIFFHYSADYAGVFIEAKKYLVETMILKRMSHSEAMEELRLLLVQAMKHGKALIVKMGDTATDFQHRFTREDCFPVADLFVEGGRRMFVPEYWEKVVREEDKVDGIFVPKPGFCVIVTSSFSPDTYLEYLCKALPLHAMQVIYIEPVVSENRPIYHP
jgi:hypothetical protein